MRVRRSYWRATATRSFQHGLTYKPPLQPSDFISLSFSFTLHTYIYTYVHTHMYVYIFFYRLVCFTRVLTVDFRSKLGSRGHLRLGILRKDVK